MPLQQWFVNAWLGNLVPYKENISRWSLNYSNQNIFNKNIRPLRMVYKLLKLGIISLTKSICIVWVNVIVNIRRVVSKQRCLKKWEQFKKKNKYVVLEFFQCLQILLFCKRDLLTIFLWSEKRNFFEESSGVFFVA